MDKYSKRGGYNSFIIVLTAKKNLKRYYYDFFHSKFSNFTKLIFYGIKKLYHEINIYVIKLKINV